MPPSGSPPPSNVGQSSDHPDPYYSNEDVGILHDIVVLAQELLPSLPERERLPTNALFSAYYDILPRIGINVDHDSRYARVLFKIGGLRGQGTLYEKFEEILSRMGIEIEFDNENTEDHDSRFEGSQTEQDLATTGETSPQDENRDSRHRPRRNSESSRWDLANEIQAKRERRRNSFSSVGHIKVPLDKEDRVSQGIVPNVEHLPLGIQSPSKDHRFNDNIRTWLSPKKESGHRGRQRSISAHGSIRIRRRSPSPTGHPDPTARSHDDYDAISEFTADIADFEAESVPNPSGQPRVAPINDETVQSMQLKVSVIHQHRLDNFVKRQLLRWKEKTLQAQEHNNGLEQIAQDHDRNVLLRSAFDAWQQHFREQQQIKREQQQAKETRDFYENLELRAQRARDLFVLHNCFTYWSSRAAESVERTAFARRQLVRSRIFHAWKENTAVNELKVRKQVLGKFLSLWQHRRRTNSEASEVAVQVYRGNLVKKIYNQWIHRICSLKATAWYTDGLKSRVLLQWVSSSRQQWENANAAETLRPKQLTANVLHNWQAKLQKLAQMNDLANKQRKEKLRQGLLRKWRSETKVIPAKKSLQAEVSTRILRQTFETWSHKARLERQAATVDRTKILQEALTYWRHKTRLKQMEAKIDTRVTNQALTSWLLASRDKEAQRQLQERKLRDAIRIWKLKQQASTDHRLEQEEMAKSFAAKRTENLVLRQWYSRMENIQSNESVAVDFHAFRLVGGVMAQWTAKLQHIQSLQQQSQDAAFYFVVSKALKLWRASTAAAQREKRKNAYAQVRRMVKMNTAREILRVWQSKAKNVMDLQAQAMQLNHNKNIVVAMDMFDRWRGRTEELSELASMAKENVLKKHVTVWQGRLNALQALRIEATISYQESQQTRALKKWNLATLQVRAQNSYAGEIREKNSKRNFRKIFQYWRQRANQRQFVGATHAIDSAQSSARGSSETRVDMEELDIEDWERRVDEIDEKAVSTIVPGYLSTPSRRSERVMAAASRFSTTPRAPLSTPFERQLRAQWSGGVPSQRRGALGKSGLGVGVSFADIADHSTNNDHG